MADDAQARAADAERSFGSGARILSIGIAATGILTFAYFSVASHVVNAVAAKRLDLLWSVMFVVISVIYRPIEQLLSRSIAERRAQGLEGNSLRTATTIQATFATIFLVVALALRHDITNHLFNGYSTLYWVLVIGIMAYAASYFARGWLAGHKYFALYGGLVLMEAVSRMSFALAVAVGIASGQSAVALGIAAAPFVSLIVVPAAFMRRGADGRGGAPVNLADAAIEGPAAEGVEEASADLSLRHGTNFALAVSAIMLSEQALLNAAVLTVNATSSDHALAGIVFNVFLITRAPLQLFQAIQTSLLPHLAGLEATEGHAAFAKAIRFTILVIAAFALAVALGLLAIGPFAMTHLFGQKASYPRLGLMIVGLGMGLHLTCGTLNQAALARGRARQAAMLWAGAAIIFLAWTLTPIVSSQLLRVEMGYSGAVGILACALWLLYRRGSAAASAA